MLIRISSCLPRLIGRVFFLLLPGVLGVWGQQPSIAHSASGSYDSDGMPARKVNGFRTGAKLPTSIEMSLMAEGSREVGLQEVSNFRCYPPAGWSEEGGHKGAGIC